LRRNFQLAGLSVIRLCDQFLDLHNAYDLDRFATDPNGSEVELSFSRNQHAIDPDSLPSKVTLRCTGNVKVAFNNLNEIAAPLNDKGIEIAYFDRGL
jgi:hypothetical protein